MVDVEVFSPGSIYLRKDMGFNLDHPLMHAFVERMSRAVLYEEFRGPHFLGEFGWRLNLTIVDPTIHDTALKWMRQNLPGKELADIFYYRTTNRDAENQWWINMVFYQKVHVMARVQKMVKP